MVVDSPLSRKAVLIAAGEANDPLWREYERSANLAYEALRQQGYEDNDIYYMSATGTVGVDVKPTLTNVDSALTKWAVNQTQDVVVYVVGQGEGAGIRLNAGQTLTTTTVVSFGTDLLPIRPRSCQTLI